MSKDTPSLSAVWQETSRETFRDATNKLYGQEVATLARHIQQVTTDVIE
jgi:hypothetical protein